MRGRFAPSPTGELHLGNLRTALVAWLHARAVGSEFLMRIEDLDAGRVREPFVASQLDDLRAIGLDWDGEPVRQSGRTELYERALASLIDRGLGYRCFCSRREIREAASAMHGARPARYPGTCAGLSERDSRARADAGEAFALRLRASEAVVEAADSRHGTLAGTADDIVLRRRDGAFAYNLAVVVDDADQGIEQVVRGDDLLDSTPDQAHLCDLLDLPRPAWTHVPLVVAPGGERLAKRHGDVTLSALAERGIGASEVAALLARSLGLAEEDERPSPAELIGRFEPAAVPAEPWAPPPELLH